jgi:hypothetical protein
MQFYSNSVHDIEYPQRGHTLLQRRDSSRALHTGQYGFGASKILSMLSDFGSAFVIAAA